MKIPSRVCSLTLNMSWDISIQGDKISRDWEVNQLRFDGESRGLNDLLFLGWDLFNLPLKEKKEGK